MVVIFFVIPAMSVSFGLKKINIKSNIVWEKSALCQDVDQVCPLSKGYYPWRRILNSHEKRILQRSRQKMTKQAADSTQIKNRQNLSWCSSALFQFSATKERTYHFEIRQLRFSKFIEFLVGDFLDKGRAQSQKEKNESEFYPQR